MKSYLRFLCAATSTYLCADAAHAAPRYFNILLTGDRAMGLGGAFTALSDDPAGIAYNPGGLAFSRSDDLSASVNLFLRKKFTVDNYFNGNDYSRVTTEIIPTFAGGSHRFQPPYQNWVGAFGIFTSDYDFIDQAIYVPNGNYEIGEARVPLVYRGTMKAYGRGTHFATAAALRANESTGLGVGLEIITLNDSMQSFHDYRIGPFPNKRTPDKPIYIFKTRNDYSELRGTSAAASLGLRFEASESVSLGLSFRGEYVLSQKHRLLVDTIDMIGTEDGGLLAESEVEGLSASSLRPQRQHLESHNASPLGRGWGQARAGVAWRPVIGRTASFDVAYHTPTRGGHTSYDRIAVINLAAGLEEEFTPTFRLAGGVFTNDDAKKEADTDYDAIIDYRGVSLVVSVVQGSSRYNVGFLYQAGDGEARGSLNPDGTKAMAQILSTAFSISSAF